VAAAELVHEKKFGRMVALSGNQIVDVPVEAGVGELKTLDLKLYDMSKTFFGM
jgi:6-phosphofructokinase 1